LTSRPRREC